jgi:hypothetical protein
MLKIRALVSCGSIEETMSQIASGRPREWCWQPVCRFRPFLCSIKRRDRLRAAYSDQIKILRQQMRELSDSTITSGVYPSLTVDYRTMGLFNFALPTKTCPRILSIVLSRLRSIKIRALVSSAQGI